MLKRHAEHHGMEVITAFGAVLALKAVLQGGEGGQVVERTTQNESG